MALEILSESFVIIIPVLDLSSAWSYQTSQPFSCAFALKVIKLCLHNSRCRRRRCGNVCSFSANAMYRDQQLQIPWLSGSSHPKLCATSKRLQHMLEIIEEVWALKDPVYQTRKVELRDQVNAGKEGIPNCESFLNAW